MSIPNYSAIQNTQYPAPTATPQPTLRSSSGIIEAYGTAVPVDGTAGYITGATFKKTDGGANTSAYVNEGSNTSCDFNAVIADVPVAYGTAAGRGASPAIWGDCPVLDYELNAQLGMHFFDDFIDGVDIANNQAVAAASALGTTGNFTGATGATAGSTVSTLATDKKGAIVLASATDNESAILAWPKGAAVAGKVSFIAGKKLWMEARLQVDSIADTIGQIFVGFAEEALIAVGSLLLINEAGLADKDYVGFVREYADGDKFNTNYNTASGGGSPVSNSNAATLVAITYTKVGIYFDGTTITFYQDGVALADTFAVSDTDFPSGEEMAFYAEFMGGASTTGGSMTLDWVRVAQEY